MLYNRADFLLAFVLINGIRFVRVHVPPIQTDGRATARPIRENIQDPTSCPGMDPRYQQIFKLRGALGDAVREIAEAKRACSVRAHA